MKPYADVSINLAQIDKSYHYLVPEALGKVLEPGCLVAVPFGKQVVQGVVLSLLDESDVEGLLPIQAVLSEDTVLTETQLSLAKWMAEAWYAPLGACISLMIPVGFSRRADIVATLISQEDYNESAFKPVQKRLLKLLKERGPLRGRQLDRAFGKIEWRGSLERLRSAGLVRTGNVLPLLASRQKRCALLPSLCRLLPLRPSPSNSSDAMTPPGSAEKRCLIY